MKKIKLSFDNLKLGSVFVYSLLILITSLLIVVGLISLPLTERLREDVSYNLITKDEQYWSKEYVLELDTSQVLDIDKQKYIDKTRDILYKRLNKAGLEEISVLQDKTETQDILRVVVKTSKDETLVDNLVQNRYFVTIVTRKEDVDFEDEENPYAYLFGENYNSTEFHGSLFRNILITELKNSSGEYSYFAVFKLWITKEKNFQNFLKGYETETIGVDIDGFVTPYYVPTGNPKTFAIPVTGGESQSQLIDILYNAGEIPLSYSTLETNNITVESSKLDYIGLSVALLVAILLVHIILLFVLKEDSKTISNSLFSTLLSVSLWITYLKISSTPVDTWLLALECILITIIIYELIHNKESQIAITTSLIISSFILITLGISYMKIFGKDLLLLTILCQFSIVFGKWYITKMKKTLLK